MHFPTVVIMTPRVPAASGLYVAIERLLPSPKQFRQDNLVFQRGRFPWQNYVEQRDSCFSTHLGIVNMHKLLYVRIPTSLVS